MEGGIVGFGLLLYTILSRVLPIEEAVLKSPEVGTIKRWGEVKIE